MCGGGQRGKGPGGCARRRAHSAVGALSVGRPMRHGLWAGAVYRVRARRRRSPCGPEGEGGYGFGAGKGGREWYPRTRKGSEKIFGRGVGVSVGSPPLIGSWATATTAVAIRRCGQVVGLAEWHMLPSWLPPTYVPECLLLACWGLGLATLWPLCSSQLRRPVTDVEPQRRFGPLWRILAVRIGSPDAYHTCADRQQRALRL